MEEIAKEYEPRILALLESMRGALQEEECLSVSEPSELGDYRWSILVQRVGATQDLHNDDVDVSVQICESEEYDGSENGVNFAVDVVTVGGAILGGLTPYNYTDQCWVSRDDSDAVAERFDCIADADLGGLCDLVWDHFDA